MHNLRGLEEALRPNGNRPTNNLFMNQPNIQIDNSVSTHERYNPSQGFSSQMGYTILSGIKQSFFDVGNTGGKFVNYATTIAASVAVGLTVDMTKELWIRLFNKKARDEQEHQKKLAALATEEALVNSLANQLRALPRQTDPERETYRALHSQYVSMLKQFSDHAAEYMANQSKNPAAAAA
jgi:hypothetical protein